MMLRHRPPLFVLLVLHCLAVLVTSLADGRPVQEEVLAKPAISRDTPQAVVDSKKLHGGTKDAPVDGKDGRPHDGPFVDIDNLRKEKPGAASGISSSSGDTGKDDLRPTLLKDRPADLTVDKDGKKIPESNDGVMDDKNRPEPKQGTTGTGGGVSEKDKARKAKEGQTGEKAEMKPETPKEAPPLPHSEQEKILGDQDKNKKKKKLEAGNEKGNTIENSSGLEVDVLPGLQKPSDLPDKTHSETPPLPDSANKDHLEVAKPPSGNRPKLPSRPTPDDANEGLIQPFHSFVLSLTMILFSEVGDKTFLVAALMAMKHDRMVVFSAAFSALITMTLLSAVLGHAVPTLIPKRVTSFLAAGLFLVFGARLMREGLAMRGDEGVAAEMQEVELELAEKEKLHGRRRRATSRASPYALEMGLAGGKDHLPDHDTDDDDDVPSNSPRSPLAGFLAGLHNLLSLLLSPAWVQTFVMTFLGEWGDRSQIATIAMAAGQDYWWVTLGAMLGHACCTGVAVMGGRAIAGRVSLKVVTVGGAGAFLIFGIIYFVEAFYS